MIPVLVLGLVWALSTGQDELAQSQSPSAGKVENPVGENRPLPARTKTWAERSLAEIIAYNPFPIPPESHTPDSSKRETAKTQGTHQAENQSEILSPLERWETQSVSIVYHGPNGPLAVIGDRTVGIGDMLDKETRVVDIRDDGVWVSQVTNNASPSSPSPPISPISPATSPGL